MPRVLRWFSKGNELEAGKRELSDISLSELKGVFPDSSNDRYMLCYSYSITEDQAAFFKEYIDFAFEFDKYDYFLEYDAV